MTKDRPWEPDAYRAEDALIDAERAKTAREREKHLTTAVDALRRYLVIVEGIWEQATIRERAA